MSKLNEKIALITGGTTGIGFATAQRFLSEGAEVVITGRRQAELDSAIKRLGSNVLGVQGDVSNLADLDRLYATIQKQKGHLDIVFANAGVGSFAPLGAITEEHFDQIFNINVKGLLFTVQKALPLLKDGGAIILNASIVASIGMEAFSVYSATKAAVRSFARTWTTDLKARKIRVNVISPGTVPTEGYRAWVTKSKWTNLLPRWRPKSRSDGWVCPMKSLKPWFSWPQMIAALSPAPSSWWTAE